MKIKLLLENRKYWWNWSVQPILILCITGFLLMSIPVYAVSKENSPENEKISLTEALYRISVEYQVFFSYDQEAVQDVVVFYEPDRYENVEHALDRMLAGTSLHYRMFNNRYIILYESHPEAINSLKDMVQHLESVIDKEEKAPLRRTAPLLSALPARTNSFSVKPIAFSVSGTVTDREGEPLIGVNIQIKDSSKGTATDFDGRFSLEDIDENAVLVVSYVGYQTKEITVAGKSNLDIVMISDSQLLDEVVVVGYGTQKKETMTGSVVSLEGDVIERVPSPNVSNSLAGRLPGLTVITETGEPGNDASLLRIRGVNTLGDNSPLVVVDGIPNRNLERLDPSTIESISVLKDASAAIYGSQAANGVILITTKRGKLGKPTISVNLNQGWNSPTVLPKMADAATYTQLVNEIYSYAGRNPIYSEEDIQKYKDGSDPLRYPNTNWFDETIKPWSPQRYGNVSLRGGVEKVKYFLSLGSNFQDGIYRNSSINYSQVDFRSNIDAEITKYINISFDVAGRQENRNYSGVGRGGGGNEHNIFWALNRTYPYYVSKWPNGLPGPAVEYGANPVVLVTDETGYEKDKRYIMQSNIKIDVGIPWVPGMILTGNVSIDKNIANQKLFQKPWVLYNWDGSSFDDDDQPVLTPTEEGFSEPRLTQTMGDDGISTINALLSYEKTVEAHDFKFLIGSERISKNQMSFHAFRRNFPSDILDQMDAGGDLLKDNGGSSFKEARLNYFGRINYGFDSKYLAEFVWRYDGSYIFPRDSRYGFFPGVSLGWLISEEGFWKNNITSIDFMKFRGGWGRTGNDRIAPYQYMTTYGYSGSYVFNGNIEKKSLSPLRIPNPNVTWEIADQYNVGIDASILEGKVMFSTEYFYNHRSDILWFRNASVPATAGLSLPQENIGEVINQGFEAQASYRYDHGAFYYQFDLNGAFAKNKIRFWDETPNVPEYQRSTGKPIGAKLYYHAIGVFVDEEEVESYPHWSGARPGDIIFEDINGDGVIDGKDMVRSNKTSVPTFTGGINFNLGYKNIYTSIFMQGAAGAERAFVNFSGGPGNGNFLWNEIKDRWKEDAPSAIHPRTWDRAKEYWMTDGQPNNTYWVRNSDYIRLKNFEIGYRFSDESLDNYGINNMRISVSGQNLLTFTGLKDHDPESPDEASGSIWVNNEVYPLNKTLNVGLFLEF